MDSQTLFIPFCHTNTISTIKHNKTVIEFTHDSRKNRSLGSCNNVWLELQQTQSGFYKIGGKPKNDRR